METFIVIGKFISLFIAIWFGVINSVLAVRGSDIPSGNIAVMSIGATAFIMLQWVI